jgi:methyltransferase
MVITRAAYLIFLGALTAERVFEVWLSRRLTWRTLARGGMEVGRIQYRIIVVFHAIFIAACVAEAMIYDAPGWSVFAPAAAIGEAIAQALRLWSIATLGESWNTRIIVSPRTPVKTAGPYRYVRHPNYCAVIIEIACVPMIYGLLLTAVACSILNALLLAFRIRLEERALGESYQREFASRPRFIPNLTGRIAIFRAR